MQRLCPFTGGILRPRSYLLACESKVVTVRRLLSSFAARRPTRNISGQIYDAIDQCDLIERVARAGRLGNAAEATEAGELVELLLQQLATEIDQIIA